MKRLLLLLPVAVLTLTGCSVVVCDRVFPKLTWAFSREAIDCRNERRMENNYKASTNELTNPK